MNQSNKIRFLFTVVTSLILASTLLISPAVAGGKAYFILTHTITDLDKYRSEYIPLVLPFIAKYDGEILVASPEAESLQGSPAKGVVVIRFPSEEAVRSFVNDPEYQPAKKLRISITTKANAVLAPELQMP